MHSIKEKIKSKQAQIGIIGLGYDGLPLALRFSEAGFKVLGMDIDESKIRAIGQGKSYIKHFGDKAVANAKEQGFTATIDFSQATDIEVLIICVPTPLNRYRDPDLSFVTNTIMGC